MSAMDRSVHCLVVGAALLLLLVVELLAIAIGFLEQAVVNSFSSGESDVVADATAARNRSCFARSALDSSRAYSRLSIQSCVTPSPILSFDKTCTCSNAERAMIKTMQFC